MKRVVGWICAVALAVIVTYHVLSTGSFLASLVSGQR